MNFLNEHLKTLKNVLAEGLEQKVDFDGSPLEVTGSEERSDINSDSDNLRKLCQHQSQEITVLRQQIFEYQQAKLGDISSTSKSLVEQQTSSQPQQNDSWFWEQDTSSTSSKKDDNGSPCEEAEVDLTTIPLDSNDHELMEKMRRQIVDRDTRLKVLAAENKVLNEKLKISSAENLELNKSIEELDTQQQLAIEKVLDVKRSLQEQLKSSLDEIKLFQQQKVELVKSYNDEIATREAEKEELNQQLKQQLVSYKELTEIAKNYEKQMDELSETNFTLEAELTELKSTVNEAPEVIEVNNDECLKKINSLVNANFKLNVAYTNEDQFVETFTKWIASTSTKIREMDFEMSKLIDENKLIKDETTKNNHERDMMKSELVNCELECSALMKNNNILMADIESLKCGGKLETIMENDDEENIIVLERQLEDSNSLNQSLEDEFVSIRTKLEATQVERSDFFDEIQQLKNQLADNVSRCKLYQKDIENLENEKSNYLFELNELKSEEERNILQKELKIYKDREVELMTKLNEMEKEFSILREKHQAMEKNATSEIQNLSSSQNKFAEENIKRLNEKDNKLSEALVELERLKSVENELNALEKAKLDLITEINEKNEALLQVQQERVSLELRSEELVKMNDANLENLKKSNELVLNLQKKILESNSAEDLSLKISSLEETLTSLEKEKESNLENLKKSHELVENLQTKLHESSLAEDLNLKVSSLEESLTALAQEKENLIALVTTKHNENVQYHNEIVRLNQLLQQEVQKAQSSQNESLEQLNDQTKFLREKCDLLAQNLLQEQNNLRLLQQEKNDAVEMNNTLNKDIERLRQHLLEVADAYTFEQVSLQKQVEDYKSKLMAIEAEAKQSATVYTSANIRANQQAETLQTQYTLLAQQRDELLNKLSAAEDNDNKNQAALTNLQVALEIFQRDKERDIELRTTSIQKELENEKARQQKLSDEIKQLNEQLREASNGLMAAARLSDQLELNQHTIERLNNEIASYRNTNQSLKSQLEESNANTSNADIDLIKNLVIGYITAPNAIAKTQILKLISNVLSLNETECSRIGLRSGGGGLGGWFSRGTNDNVNNNVTSLTEAFVAFLEKESQPRVNTNLLTIHENDSNTSSSRKTSLSGSIQENTESPTPLETASSPAPILHGDNSLLTPYNNRSSSTILKDLLHDT